MVGTDATPTHFKDITEIVDFASKMEEPDDAEEFIRCEVSNIQCLVTEDRLEALIGAVRGEIKNNGSETEAKTEGDYLELLQEKVPFNAKTRLPDAKTFIKDYMLDEEPDFVEAFIYNSAKSFFGFTSFDIGNLKKFYNRVKREHDVNVERAAAINELGIDQKYDGMYTIYYDIAGVVRVRINPHADNIADLIIEENFIVSYMGSLFIYRGGFYRNEPETVEDKIVQVLNEICKGDNSDNMHKKKADILTQIRTKTRVHVYPFNNYRNALPVKNGVLILDFESGTSKLVDHDPLKYKFNYQIPVEFNPDIDNTVIYDTLKTYVDDPTGLIQIPAQAFMQAMGYGPYKRAYLIHGEKNSGKTTFIDILEYLVGDYGFCDVSLDQITQRFQIASLEGKLLNMHDDVGYFTLGDTGLFKTLTGRRKHDIEKKGIQPYTATLDCVHIFTTNTPAKFDSRVKTDAAFWERWSFITFDKPFDINGGFKAGILTPENMTAFLNKIIAEMLQIGKTGKLSADVSWSDTRERWMLAGNPLYKMVIEMMDPETPGSNGTAIIKEELLKTLKAWCVANGIDKRVVPESLKALTSLVDACGWDVDEQRLFEKTKERKRCYVIPYKWKSDEKVAKYIVKVTKVETKQDTLN